jgi:hypothetical protein
VTGEGEGGGDCSTELAPKSGIFLKSEMEILRLLGVKNYDR